MDIRDNHLSLADPDLPDNEPRDPQTEPNRPARLPPLLPTDAGTAGIDPALDTLRFVPGETAKSIQVHSQSMSSSDMLLDAELSASIVPDGI